MLERFLKYLDRYKIIKLILLGFKVKLYDILNKINKFK